MAIANALAFLFYLSCSVLLIRRFAKKDSDESKLLVPVGMLTVLALLFHGADIFFTMRDAGGWSLGLFTTLSIVAWLMAFITLVTGSRFAQAHPGMIIYPLVALTLVFKTELPSPNPPSLAEPALEWHVLLSLAAYGLFTLAALQSIVLAIQEKQLRQKHISRLILKLPPLQTMEASLFQLLNVGFVLLTMGLLTGFMFLENIFSQHLVHKTVLSIIAWCVFASLLWGRKRYGWRGKTAVKWTLAGFAFLVLAYLGSQLVLEFFLHQA